MTVKIKENWILYDKPEDRCIIRFNQNGMEVVRIVFYFSNPKKDYIGGRLMDHFPISESEERQYLLSRRESAMQRTRNLKHDWE